MAPSIYFRSSVKDKTIRKLSTKVKIEEIVTIARADFLGRTTKESLSGIYEAGDWMLEKSKELDVYNHPPLPFIQGRDLIALGLEPSKKFKTILEKVYIEQLEGRVSNYQEAILFLQEDTN